MPRYPGLIWRPLPENATQPAEVKTHAIYHSTGDNLGADATWQYFARPDVVVESTFVVGFDGGGYQMLDSALRADANVAANASGISVETVGAADQPWTQAQIDRLLDLSKWISVTHDVPLVMCPTWDGAGFGYHRMHPEWSLGGTSCPNDLRVKQFHDVLMPTLLSGGDMPLSDADWVKFQQMLVDVSTKQGYAGVAQSVASALRTEGVSGAAGLAAQTLALLQGHAQAPGVDPAEMARQIAAALPDDLARRLADELAKRLAG